MNHFTNPTSQIDVLDIEHQGKLQGKMERDSGATGAPHRKAGGWTGLWPGGTSQLQKQENVWGTFVTGVHGLAPSCTRRHLTLSAVPYGSLYHGPEY